MYCVVCVCVCYDRKKAACPVRKRATLETPPTTTTTQIIMEKTSRGNEGEQEKKFWLTGVEMT